MDADRWLEVQQILLDLLDEPTEHRGRALKQHCVGQPTLRAELEELVEAASDGDRYFDDLARRAGLSDPIAARTAVQTLMTAHRTGPRAFGQDVRYCRTPDGATLAYSTIGDGPPLVRTPNWLNHLEFDAESPVWAHWIRELSRDHQLVRYDERGCGLSDWDAEITFEACVTDLETVVDTLGLERFPLLGISAGGAIAIAYAARHPERVSRLILHGSYGLGPVVVEIHSLDRGRGAAGKGHALLGESTALDAEADVALPRLATTPIGQHHVRQRIPVHDGAGWEGRLSAQSSPDPRPQRW